MPRAHFDFKQFRINQDKCAMKVGTDAVLLGAWTEAKDANSILDIGTGTGVIALMLAQKNKLARVVAIDIDKGAFTQAAENVSESKFNQQISVVHQSLQEFCDTHAANYNLIVSNPPYFIDSYKSISEERNSARHTDQLSFDELISGVRKLLSIEGKFCLILPTKEGLLFREKAASSGLYLTRLMNVKSKKNKEVIRTLMQFELKNKKLEEAELVIENEKRHAYTTNYKKLTGAFYLNF